MNDVPQRRIRVLHVITGLHSGGAEGVLYNLCKEDVDTDHVVISMMHAAEYSERLRDIGVHVHHLDMPRGRMTFGGLMRLFRLVRSARPDVVQTWMYHADLIGGIVARAVGVKRVVWGIRHSDLAAGHSKRSTRLVARLSGMLSRVVPVGIVSCADSAARAHIPLGYDPRRMVVIENGYDFTRFRVDEEARRACRTDLGLSHDEPVIGMVARLHPQKDHRNLLSAVAQALRADRQFRCVLAGADASADNPILRESIVRHGVQDHVLALGRRADIPRIMNALDLHVLSSSGEGFPNVLAEAMACGTPCVSTDVGDAARIVGDTGWIVPPGDSVALAAAIAKAVHEMTADPIRWEGRRQAARARCLAEFGVDRMVRRYQEVWRSVVRHGRLPPGAAQGSAEEVASAPSVALRAERQKRLRHARHDPLTQKRRHEHDG